MHDQIQAETDANTAKSVQGACANPVCACGPSCQCGASCVCTPDSNCAD